MSRLLCPIALLLAHTHLQEDGQRGRKGGREGGRGGGREGGRERERGRDKGCSCTEERGVSICMCRCMVCRAVYLRIVELSEVFDVFASCD